MADILENLSKLLPERAMPAVQKLASGVANIAAAVRDKAAELGQPIGQPAPAPSERKLSAAPAEEYMVSPVPTAQPEETAEEVSHRLFSQGGYFDSVELLFITDAEERLQGVVALSKLLMALPQTAMQELMAKDVASVALSDHTEQVAEVALTHRLPAVPVVDAEERLCGAVPAHEVFKILRQDHLQDMGRLVGIWRNSEQALSAIEGDPLRRMLDRLPWLIVGTVGCVLATGLMATFEATLSADVAVAFFIPGIVYLADAIGTQSEAIAVRGLSLTSAPVQQLLRGELKTGFFLGIALAVALFPVIWLVFNASLAFAVSVALVCASSVATGIGLLLPSILARMGKDPAYGSGPVATIVQDLLSLLIYLSVVSMLVL